MDWLTKREPEIVFDTAKLLTESAWITVGELVFEAPLAYESAEKFRTADWYDKLKVPLTAEGIVPGRRYVVRKKGVVETRSRVRIVTAA
jgi:hypothetical protein